MFFDKKLSESSEIFYLEPGLYPSFTDIVEALKTFVRESHKHREICICTNISRQDTQLFYSILPEQMNLEGQWEVAVSEASYTSMYQNVTEGKFKCFDKKLSKLSEFSYLKTGLFPSITDIVEALKTFVRESHKHREKFITVEVSRRRQKVEIYPANDGLL